MSTATLFRTGKAPGNPRHTGQTFWFGGAPKLVGQAQKILVRVASWTCTSSPITGSYFANTSGGSGAAMVEDITPIIGDGDFTEPAEGNAGITPRICFIVPKGLRCYISHSALSWNGESNFALIVNMSFRTLACLGLFAVCLAAQNAPSPAAHRSVKEL